MSETKDKLGNGLREVIRSSTTRRCADCGQVYLGSRFDDAKCPGCESTGAMTILAGAMLLVVCWVVTCGVGVGAYLCAGGKVPWSE